MLKITLNDLLNISQEDCENVRVKFNQYNGLDDPVDYI